LKPEQIDAIVALESDVTRTAEEVRTALKKVPGLSDEQIQLLVDLEMSLNTGQEHKDS
jgi:hypothetical protein